MDVPVESHLPHETAIDRDVPHRPPGARRAEHCQEYTREHPYDNDEWDEPSGDNKTSGNKTSDNKLMPF